MNLRPKTKRRLLILLTAGIAGTAMATCAVVVQLRRYENHRLAFRAAAMDAFGHGDYRTACDYFAKYLGNDRMDSPAIFDYAVARSKVPRADLSNLTDAKDLFNRYLELNPGDVNAEHQLLDLYQKLRYATESAALSDELLSKNPDDVDALSARLGRMIREHHYDQALPISEHLNDLMPDDVETQNTTYELMWRLHKPAADLLERADRMLEAHPEDPRFELLRAVAAFWSGDKEEATKWLRTAASRPSPDGEFTLLLAGAFDRMELWTDSRTLLEQNAAAPAASATLKANLVQRLWEIARYDQALMVLKGLNPADPGSDSGLIGLQALVLYDQSKPAAPPSGFKVALLSLQHRPDDLVAGAWASLLSAMTDSAPGDPLAPVRLCQSARRSDPQNPDAAYFLGREYLRIGESELGLQSLRQAAQMQPEWAGPYVLIAATLMQRGQTTAAATAARAALNRDPHLVGAQITFALASYHQLVPGASVDEIQAVLNYIQQLRNTVPEDPHLLAAQVDLMARADHKTDAINLAIASKPSPGALHQLAQINESDHLEIDKQLSGELAACQPTAPEQALDLVEADLLMGNTDAARAILPVMKSHPTPGWQIAELQAREALGDETVRTGWEQFADSFPRDLNVQTAAIHSPVVMADPPLMERAIDRLKTLTGEDAIEWKLARARWKLSSGDDVKTRANAAAASMAEVAQVAPDYAVPQEIWADALLNLGDLNGAIAHVRLATQIEPDNAALALQLARLYEQQGQFQELASLLDSARARDWFTNPQRIQVARLYRQMGDRASAVKLLDENHAIHLDDPARDILLAQLHAELGEDADVQQIYGDWSGVNNPPAEMVRAIAGFYASHHWMPLARRALAGLNNFELAAGEKDLFMGQFEAQWGDKSTAALEFQSSTQAAPGNLQGWLAWAGMNLRNRDFTGAFNVANEGLKHLPADPTLLAMRDRAQAVAGLQLDADAQALLDVLSVDPANEAGVATVTAIVGSETPADADTHLKAVAEQYPRFLPVQTMLIVHDFRAGLYDQAIDRATRASESQPIEPEPARLLSSIYSASAQWQKALSAAEDWRNRSLDDPHPADVAIASVQIALRQPDRAAEQLSWCVAGNTQSDTQAKALELYAKARCMLGRPDEAQRVLRPLMSQSAIWRHRWLRIVADTAPDMDTASQWILKVLPLMPPSNPAEDEFSLGETWYMLATRFDSATAMDKAKSIVEPLTDFSSAPAEAWMLLGNIQEQQNDLPAAQTSFAAAVNLAPNSAVAKNDLAMVMLLRHEDAKTAQQLARAAVAQAPANSALHSTLGEIDEQMNDFGSAKTQFQMAVKLDMENAEALIGLASVQSRTGETNRAALTLQQAETVIQASHPILPAPVRDELVRLRGLAKRPATPAAIRSN